MSGSKTKSLLIRTPELLLKKDIAKVHLGWGQGLFSDAASLYVSACRTTNLLTSQRNKKVQ